MTEERKYAILFAATLLCARKLIELDSERPSPAKIGAVEDAIRQAAFILERIDAKWPEKCRLPYENLAVQECVCVRSKTAMKHMTEKRCAGCLSPTLVESARLDSF